MVISYLRHILIRTCFCCYGLSLVRLFCIVKFYSNLCLYFGYCVFCFQLLFVSYIRYCNYIIYVIVVITRPMIYFIRLLCLMLT